MAMAHHPRQPLAAVAAAPLVLALLALLALNLAAGADAASFKATQCMWGGALCDLSSAYVVARAHDIVPAAPGGEVNATSEAMLRAAARDAVCGARPTMQSCKAAPEADGCAWFDAEVREAAPPWEKY